MLHPAAPARFLPEPGDNHSGPPHTADADPDIPMAGFVAAIALNPLVGWLGVTARPSHQATIEHIFD
jgi:hypothetical protein